MKQRIWTRCLSLLLAACLVFSLAPTAIHASPADSEVRFEEISPEEVSADLRMEKVQPKQEQETRDPDEQVRVSIVLEKAPVLDQGYSTMGLAANQQAAAYRQELLADQQAVTARISKVTGRELDVAWNLTLAGNIISANVRYGDMEKIAATRGVAQVVLETRYAPCVAEVGGNQPNMASATTMTGSNLAWLAGYTGAGSRIAIIDTGLDTDHQSMDNGAYLYALGEEADSLNLLGKEEIASVLPQLNIYKGYNDAAGAFVKDDTLTAEQLFVSEKVPFGYNYIDRDLDITHDNDNQGGHGSHVAGIAAANRYVPAGDGYESAAQAAHMTGVAPDAQLLVMKVFGKDGGAYDSDYMAAMEDAVLLDADVVNLSLGSANPGFTTSAYYQDIMDRLANSDTVVSISAGNNYAWPSYSAQGYLYAEDGNYHTGGSPGTYANSFTVASVDNCGMTGLSFRVAERDVVYTETLSRNSPFATLDASEDGSGTELPYIFLDSLGNSEDYETIDVAGKVVFVSRGESSFSDKLTAADNASAAACVIYNNVPGTAISMDLSGSYAWIPCVSITRDDADVIRTASQAVTDEAGNVLYYTGTMTVGSNIATAIPDSDYNTMSSFSSWGVTGNLTLKPEITAPGGNIYSIDGATYQTDQYVIMSGTSMAAPHISGLTALLSQYYRQTGLAEKLGVSPRVLSQSLLMSTATPIVDGNSGLPYPVIQQGAGLANAYDAMNASSYVLVNGQADGKVKAELGDDPNRTGVYTFDYTLHNMTLEAQRYTLDADVYTQNAFQEEDIWYADYLLTKLNATATYTVDGREILPENGEVTGCDYNGDGKVNEADGQALLDYAVGKPDEIQNLENADLNEDGKVTAYDAELFLARLGQYTLELPASGSVTVCVTITLTEDDKALLDAVYPNGAYIEAYVTATPLATAEGVLTSAHSIPVLAFYGGWDEASMFDRATHTQIVAGSNERDSYFPASMFGASDGNYVSVVYGDAPESTYYLGGNPYATDAQYLPARNAIRSNNGDCVSSLNFSLIRNAGGFRASITNRETGERCYEETADHVYSAFYFPNYGAWQNMSQSLVPNGSDELPGWFVTDSQGQPLPEGTQVDITLQAATEYHVQPDGSVNWDALDASGSSMTLPVTVDNTAPVLKSVSVGTQTDPVTGERCDFVEAVAQDNRYTAAVILLTPGGTKVVGRQSANQTELGAESRIRLNMTGIFGSTFHLAVVDYAGNATYYNVRVSEPFDGPSATLYGATTVYGSAAWQRFASDANYDYESVLETEGSIGGAAYGDGYLFYCSTDPSSYDSQYYLYVADYPSFENPIQIGKVSGSPYYQAPIDYLAYHTVDGYLYYVKQGSLYRMDVADASETLVAQVDAGDISLTGLAYSAKEDCFYALGHQWGYDSDLGQMMCPTALLRFRLPEEGKTIVPEQVSDLGVWPTAGGFLALDEKQDAAYILRNRNLYADLLTYEFGAGTLTVTGQLATHKGVFLPDDATANDNRVIRTEPTAIQLSASSLNVFVNGSKTLTAQLKPWCLADKSVKWSSDNEAIATVDENGNITGVSEGTATITAASVLKETICASCTVTVVGNRFTVQGVGVTAEGESRLFAYDLASKTLTAGQTLTDAEGNLISVESASDDAASDLVWVQDHQADEEGNGYRLHIIDPATGKSTYDSAANTNNSQDGSLLLSDMIYDDWNQVVLGTNGTGKLFFSENPKGNDVGTTWFNLDSRCLAAVARGRTWQYYMTKYTTVYALDATNNRVIVCELSYSPFFGAWTTNLSYYDMDQALTYTPDSSGVYQDSMVYDAVTGTPILFHRTDSGMEVYALSLEDSNKTANTVSLGMLEGYENMAIYSAAYTGAASAPEVTPSEPQGQQILLTTSGEAMGSTNAAAEVPVKEDDSMLTVTLKAEEAAASGMLEIALDENLTLVSLESPARRSSYAKKDGKLVFGYAGTESIAKDGVLAVLRLKHNGKKATLTALETERGGKAMDVSTVVTIPADCCDGGKDCPSAAFSDLDTKAWYHEYTDFVLEHKLMNGMGNGIFAPNGTVNRAMAVTLLYRMAGEPAVKGGSPFQDVKAGSYYANAVAWAYENGIVKGMTKDQFAPTAPATREQLVTFLYRFAAFSKRDLSAKGDLSAFSDGSAVSPYAKDAVSWAVGTGLLVGDGTGRLLPKESGTRAQLAALIARFLA